MKFLEGIAQKLRLEAQTGLIARHRLRRKLALTLRREDINGDWVLSMSRQSVPPSELEEAACRRAFGVSEQAERHHNEMDGWHIVRLRWRPLGAPAGVQRLFETQPEMTGSYYREGL